jgi:hypothetical protein
VIVLGTAAYMSPVPTSPTLQLGTPTPLFVLTGGHFAPTALEDGLESVFDVSRDGKRFLVAFPELVGDEFPVTVISHWISEVAK